MEESSKDCEASTSKATTEDNEDVIMAELDHIEKILEKDSSDELKFLEFERQMFLDCIYNDGLVICAK